MSHIFISYSHDDSDYAHKLEAELKRRGFDVWIDDRIGYSTTGPLVIEEHLDACAAVVLIMTPSSKSSVYVQNELAHAHDKQKPIFPLLLEGDNWLAVQAIQHEPVRGGRLPTESFYDQLAQVVAQCTITPETCTLIECREFDVYAHQEDGIDTGLRLSPGQQYIVCAEGKVSIDKGLTWWRADGQIITGPGAGKNRRVPNTHLDDQGDGKGAVGALIGWIGDSRDATFLIGCQRTLTADRVGNLKLGVNDTRGDYWDNVDQEGKPTHFSVRVEVYSFGQEVEASCSDLKVGAPAMAHSALVPDRQPFEPEMIRIPAGEFLMGSDPRKDRDAGEYEQPQHRLYLPDYYIAKTPVTNARYLAFVRSTGKNPPKHWEHGEPPAGKDDHPVVNVSWCDAIDYCCWLTKVTGKHYRLPSEPEWEKAARGTDGRIYPWGDQWDGSRANTRESGVRDTTPVDAHLRGASPYGLLDMAGNVLEWTRSLWTGSSAGSRYPYNSQDGREGESASSFGDRIARGGGFLDSWKDARCACRCSVKPDVYTGVLGFRISCKID